MGESVSISASQYIVGSPHEIVNGLTSSGNVYFGDESG